MAGRDDFAERREARIERLREAGRKAEKEAASQFNMSCEIGKRFEFGQPILVGHHSEKRSRRDRERMDESMRRSVNLNKKAGVYLSCAEAAEKNTAISSDDPEAAEKLQAKIEALKSKHAAMKAQNAAARKAGMPAPFAPYQLTNNNARIKQAEKRLRTLERVDEMVDEVIPFAVGEIVSDSVTNRVIIKFDERQDDEMVAKLKGYGFKWAPSSQGWQRLRTPLSLERAKRICNA